MSVDAGAGAGAGADATRVGVVGLGAIGAGVARHAVTAGLEVCGFDVRPQVCDALPGVTPVSTLAELAAAADVAVVAVFDDAQMKEVLGGTDGLLHAPTPPEVIVVVTTVTMESIRWASEAATRAGVGLLDCGVAGGSAAMEAGTMVCMVGGEGADFARALPVIKAFGEPVVHLGPVGAGMAAKLARNMITYAERVVVWEAARLALAGGVRPEGFLEIVEATDQWNSHVSLLRRGFMPATEVNGDPAAGLQASTYAHKDLRAAQAFGNELGLQMSVTALADGLYEAAAGYPNATRT